MIGNLFQALTMNPQDEQFDALLQHRGVRIERIVSHGHASPDGFWYDQDWDEWVLVLSGSAELEFEDAVLRLTAGDHVMIEAHRRHRVRSTAAEQATVWLAIHWDAHTA